MTYRNDNDLLPYITEPHLPRFCVALALFSLGMFTGLVLAAYVGVI